MPTAHRRTLLLLGVGVFILCACVHYLLLQGTTHVVDEASYLLQAKLFASGQRVGTALPLPDYFFLAYWYSTPQAYSAFPFGWPLLLSLGTFFEWSGLINPLCAGFLPYLCYRIVLPARGSREALIAALVVGVSPGIWVLGGSLMSHTSCLVAAMGLWVALRKAKPNWWLAGLCWAYWLWARPFEGVLFGFPLTLWAVWSNWPVLLRLGGCYTVAVAVLLIDNHQLTGSLFQFPVNAWFEEKALLGTVPAGCNALGFGDNIGCIPTLGTMGHSISKALSIAQSSLFRFDYLIFGISGMSLWAVLGLWRWRSGWRYAFSLFVPVLAYMLYWSPGSLYGARFYHALYLFIPMLMAAGLSILPRKWPYIVVVGLALAGGSGVARDLGNGYRCVTGELASAVQAHDIQGTVFLDIRHRYMADWPALWSEPQECTVIQMVTGVVAENSDTLHIRQLPGSTEEMLRAPKPHYVLRKWSDGPAELLHIEAD